MHAAAALNKQVLYDALRQAFANSKFIAFNPQLTPGELAGLRSDPIIWPAKPVFSPYAATKRSNEYSQIR